jgi:hypothetical protein
MLMFTNGSMIDWDFLANYAEKITLVFSLDSVGRSAEYIRYGTDWPAVLANYQRDSSLANVSVRVNITMSVYNYLYLEPLFDLLCGSWPSLVTFGTAHQAYLTEAAVPLQGRDDMINSLTRVLNRIQAETTIESGQWHNAINAIQTAITRLTNTEFDSVLHNQLINYIAQLDRVKHIELEDYCPELSQALGVQRNQIAHVVA